MLRDTCLVVNVKGFILSLNLSIITVDWIWHILQVMSFTLYYFNHRLGYGIKKSFTMMPMILYILTILISRNQVKYLGITTLSIQCVRYVKQNIMYRIHYIINIQCSNIKKVASKNIPLYSTAITYVNSPCSKGFS